MPLAELPDEVIVVNEKPIAVKANAVVKELKEITKAVKENTVTRENDVYSGAYRAMARYQEPIDEIECEMVDRLRKDGWSWIAIAKQIDPDIAEENIESEANRLKQQYHRDKKRKPQ